MIAHEHGNERYAHYAWELYPSVCYHIVGLFAKLLHNLEQPPVSSSRELFHGVGCPLIYHVISIGMIYVCKDYELHPLCPFLFHTFCMFSSIIVGMPTNIGV